MFDRPAFKILRCSSSEKLHHVKVGSMYCHMEKMLKRGHTTWLKVHIYVRGEAIICTKYHITLFKVPHHPLQSTTSPSSKYHITLFKVPHHPIQSTTQFSSKYHTILFKVPHHPLQRTTPPSSKYHTTLFKVPHHPLQIIDIIANLFV